MALRKVKDGGSGTIVIYHVPPSLDEVFKEAAGSCALYVETFESGKGLYANPSMLAEFQDSGPLILGGFSEGCQALRAQFLRGVMPLVAVAADGVHSPNGTAKGNAMYTQTIAPWQVFAEHCKESGGSLTITTTETPAVKYLSTRETACLIFPDYKEWDHTFEGAMQLYTSDSRGTAIVLCVDGADHGAQGSVWLPTLIAGYAGGKGPAKKPHTIDPPRPIPPSPVPPTPVPKPKAAGFPGELLMLGLVGAGVISRFRK